MPMKTLDQNWFTEGLMDFEYKKYLLLAYLQEVHKNFSDYRLYPFLSDLIMHYQNLCHVRDNKAILYDNFPKHISREAFRKLKLVYKRIVKDEEFMEELENILGFAIPEMQSALRKGKDLFEEVSGGLELNPVGLSPIYQEEGYLFIDVDADVFLEVFRYRTSVFQQSDEKYRGIHLDRIGTEKKSPAKTYEQLKLHLIRAHKDLPNPATFALLVRKPYPIAETVLPVVKRLLIRHISQAA